MSLLLPPRGDPPGFVKVLDDTFGVEQGLMQTVHAYTGDQNLDSTAVVADYESRYRMVELACQDELGFAPSRIEEDEGISYSIHTIEKVKTIAGAEAQVYFLIGADAFAEIQSWHRWGDVVRQAAFIVVTRPGHHYRTPPGCTVHRLDTLAMPVSSSDIRASLARIPAGRIGCSARLGAGSACASGLRTNGRHLRDGSSHWDGSKSRSVRASRPLPWRPNKTPRCAACRSGPGRNGAKSAAARSSFTTAASVSRAGRAARPVTPRAAPTD